MSNQYTLIELLEKYEVRIPIIQRDYVQGRRDEKGNEVRKNLIRDIKKCLQEDNKRIDFNFVYGTSKGKEFFPVDGQQRLTTLYLLHWYLACFDDKNLADFNEKNAFSYKTRNSATEFFAVLHQTPEALKRIVREERGNIREKIMNEAWFQAEWANDPTVDAVLTFLNDLSNDKDDKGVATFSKNASDYYKKLKEEKLFYFTVIVEDGEQAETKAAKSYIRMNARGKVLEQFENVKAMLDSIEEKINKERKEKELPKITDFILHYDISYINELFNDVVGKSLKCTMTKIHDDDEELLKYTTEKINEKSLDYLIKLYLLLLQWQKHLARKSCTKTQFVSEIYEYSNNCKKEDLEFFKTYFQLLTAIFEYYKNSDKETVKVFFEPGESFCMSTDRKNAAIALYIYYYYMTQKKTLEKEQIAKFLYVLENLNYTEWSTEYFVEILDKAAAFAAERDDIFACFRSTEDVSCMQEALNGCALPDYLVRIKEQSIKAKLCADNNLNWDFFYQLERKNLEKKLQYLFFISNYWVDYSQGDYDKLIKYKKIAEKYFCNVDEELTWRKHYAVAVHTRNGKLSSAEEINKLYTQKNKKYHIWEDKFYFWSDGEEGTSWTLKLPYIKWIYEQLCAGKDIETDITEHELDYGKCWLYHALKGQQKELLTVELKWKSEADIIYALDGNYEWVGDHYEDKGHRYDLYIKHIDKKYPMKYGIKKLTLGYDKEKYFTFYPGNRYEGRIINLYEKYNVYLSWKSEITNLYSQEEIEETEKRGYYEPRMVEGKRVFIIVEANKPYELVEKYCDITEEWEKINKAHKTVEMMVSEYTVKDWLNIIDDEHSDGWKRRTYRTWEYKGKIPMKIPYIGKILSL